MERHLKEFWSKFFRPSCYCSAKVFYDNSCNKCKHLHGCFNRMTEEIPSSSYDEELEKQAEEEMRMEWEWERNHEQ